MRRGWLTRLADRLPDLPTEWGGVRDRLEASLDGVNPRGAVILATVLVAVLVGAAVGAAVAPFLSNSVPVSGPVSIGSPNGNVNATLTGSVDANLTNPWPDDSSVEFRTSEGNVTFTSGGEADVTIDAAEINGTFTNATVDVSSGELEIDPGDKPAVNVSGDLDSISIRESMAADDGQVDFVYEGSSGTTTVTVRGLSANTQYGAIDRDSGIALAAGTTDGSGTVTFSGMPNSEHTVILETTDGGPIVDNSSASPTGELTTVTPQLSIDISDPDIPPGDNLTVRWHVDGQEVATETVHSNGTVTHTTDELFGGSHTWNVTVEDAYGASTQSQDFTMTLPENVTIREEVPEPHDVIKQATIVVLVSGSQETLDRQVTTTGNISLDGLPIDERYVVVVNAEGYHQRPIYVPDIFEQSSVFLLNESNTTVQNTLVVQDNTGQFDSPILNIEKPINRSLYDDSAAKKYQWTTIAGDRLGASGSLTVDLKKNARYRFTVRNQDGDTRVLGEYTAELNGTITLTIGELTWENPTGDGYQIEAYQENVSGTGEQITVQYEDANNGTSEFCLTVHEAGNTSEILYPEDCASDIGTYKAVIPVTGADLNTSWVANWSATVDGTEVGSTIPLTNIRELPIPIDSDWLGAGVYILLIGGLAATPKSSARTGAVLVAALAFGLTWWGWVAIPGPALAITGALALLGKAADFNQRY